MPFLLVSMMAFAVVVGWTFYTIKSRSLDLESALFLAKNRIEELRNPDAVATTTGPEGEANPAAMLEIAAFPELRARLPKPHINTPNPLDSGLKRVLYQAGEDPSFVPVTLMAKVGEAIREIQKDPAHVAVYRRLHEADKTVLPIFAEHDLPPMLTAVLWLESQGSVEYEDVQSGRLGLWALTEPISERHGLDLRQRPDPRLNPTAATYAARSYLIELFHRGGGRSWVLAAMAYHDGPALLDRIRSRRATWGADDMNVFNWLREEMIPWETRPYLYKLLAMAVLQEEAVAFRLRPEDDERRFNYER